VSQGTFDVVVTTTTGQVGGSTVDGVHTFKGIPYAAPTGGQNRFKPPQPALPWPGIRDATAYGPTAPQRSHAEMGGAEPADPASVARMAEFSALISGLAGREPPQGEDCLVLNVWTAGLDTHRSRPVMVWIHGGAFESGSGSWPLYDGTPLAARGDAVFVTLNHRLGVMGFLYLDEIGGPSYAGSGNAGMLDIVQALQWIRDNIRRFGGDPDKVLVFGGSGGASKTATLLGMPAARGLFHRGALLSGPLVRVRTREAAAALTRQLFERLELAPDQIHQLHDMPYSRLIEEASRLAMPINAGLAQAASPEAFMPLQPVVDGVSLPAQPLDPASPHGTGVATMIGSTQDDMKMMMLGMPWFGTLTEGQLRTMARASFGDSGDAAIAAYRRAYPAASATEMACQFVTDRVMWIGSIDWAERKVAGGGAPVYLYRFDYATPIMGGVLGATHGGDIPFALNNFGYTPLAGERPENAQMGALMSETFVRFADTGNPNHGGLPDWRPYAPGDRCTLIFDSPCRVESDPRSELRALYATHSSR
jgi:para-nitrobenzyl esterase